VEEGVCPKSYGMNVAKMAGSKKSKQKTNINE
jgi:DNA mismatch repair ATPase MutS